MPIFYEFFAGGGMARAGLGPRWSCSFANDFDDIKSKIYRSNWGDDHFSGGDIRNISAHQLPGQADLAWASFPCQDLSLAGTYTGLDGKRSGTFWPFWNLMRDLAKDGRAPKIVTVENVYGAITANDGQDFQAIASAFSGADYRFGAMIIDARHFVPQSRPRFFMIGVRGDLEIPDKLISKTPIPLWHPQRLVNVAANLSERAMRRWVWWALQKPPSIRTSLADILEDSPTSVEWHTVAETKRLLGMMTPLNRAKVTEAMRQGTCEVGAVYKRVRTDTSGNKQQRAEARFDNIAGCLRTPRGGSSRQTLLVIEGSHVRSRLLSSREAARLMGLPDNYRLPSRYNDAYQLAGDGVVVPVVAHLRKYLFESVLDVNTIPSRMAV